MEVTRSNFSTIRDGFEDDLRSSAIVSVDLELSGLQSSPDYPFSLFDSGCERYYKIRKRSVGIITTQVGLSIYQHDRTCNTYNASAYTFHLSPQSIGSVMQTCTFEASVIGFLKDSKFDFNKFAYEGIPYLNRSEGLSLQKDINENNLEDNISTSEMEKIGLTLLKIHAWKKSDDESLTLPEYDISLQIILFQKLQIYFPDLIINFDGSEIVVARKKENDILPKFKENATFLHANGFTNIIELLIKYKKPLILHNGLMDLMIIYNQFINRLPTSYDSFKNHINELFPKVYDSKFMFNSMRSVVRREKAAENSSLQNLYEFFTANPKAMAFGLFPPRIKLKSGFEESPWFHHAGWDAYCTGFCFLRLCHWSACEKIGTSREMTNSEHLNAVNKYCNQIYLSRGAQPHICLDKIDPIRHRPKYLYIETLKDKTINLAEIIKLIGALESADVKKYNEKSALVAVTNNHSMKRLMESLKKNNEFKVAQFNIIKHSKVVRIALWSGFILSSSSLVAYVFYKM